MGYKVMMAHEFEFYVLEAETMEPLFGGLFIFNNVRNHWAPFIDELLGHVQAMGIDVITHNCEYAPSQFEINYRPAFGLAGADKGFTFKNAVKEFVHRAGYHATFMSKPWPDRAGSGCHVHVSLWDRSSDENAFVDLKDDLGLSNLAKSFIQGQLVHGRAMMALQNPTPNCYHRVKPYTFAPSNISWGIEDRTAMVRVKATRDDRTHVENRLASAMANPYLSAAATLAAGLLGIEARLELRAESAGLAEDDASWPNLPRNLEESLDALAEDHAFRAMLGEEFFEVFNAVKRFELACFHSHVTDWSATNTWRFTDGCSRRAISLNPRMRIRSILARLLELLGKVTAPELDSRVAAALNDVRLDGRESCRYRHEITTCRGGLAL